MNIKKPIIIFIVIAFLTVLSSSSYAKTQVYTSISVAGVIGGGVYWYFSVGTEISKRERDYGYALLPRLYISKIRLQQSLWSQLNGEEELTLYLPLYNIKF